MYKYRLPKKNIEEKVEVDTKLKQFHQDRMGGFDLIGDLLGQINPLLDIAKKETEEYYKQNPTSYNVVYSTDLIADYIRDIIKMLKKEE